MTFDWYTELAALLACPADGRAPEGLALVFVDGCTTWLAVNQVRAAECEERLKGEHDKKSEALEQEKQRHERAKNDARRCYMERAVQGAPALPPELNFDLWPPRLFQDAWLAIAVGFELLTPWYSKDDRLFHVLDNPVRKDRVFGVPDASRAEGPPRAGQALRGVDRPGLDPAPVRQREGREERLPAGRVGLLPHVVRQDRVRGDQPT